MKGEISVLSDDGRLRHRRGYGRGRKDKRRSIAKERWLEATPGRMLCDRREKEGRVRREGLDESIHRSYLTYRSNS